jgi:hypothetical protein
MCSALFKATIFQYRFLAIPGGALMGSVITRQHAVTPEATPPLANFTLYAYPFQDFPLLESHLHPRFVLLDTGRKLKELTHQARTRLCTQYDILNNVLHIYDAWSRDPPERFLSDREFNPECPSEDDSDGDDDRLTARGRCKNARKRRRNGGSPTERRRAVKGRKGDPGRGGKQQRDVEMEAAVGDEMESRRYGNAGNIVASSRPSHSSGKNSVGLSGETLRDHYERVGKASTSQRISEWVSDCLVGDAKRGEEDGAFWAKDAEEMAELALLFCEGGGGGHGW